MAHTKLDWLPESLGAFYRDGAEAGTLSLYGLASDHDARTVAERARGLAGLRRVSIPLRSIGDAAFNALAGLGVELAVCELASRRLPLLEAHAERVVDLDLQIEPGDAAESARRVARLERLRALKSHLAPWSDAQLAQALGGLAELETLALPAATASGRGLAALPRPERLRELDLTEPWEHTSRGTSPITDHWAALARMTGLQRFRTGVVRLEGDALGGLAACTDLRALTVIGATWSKPELGFLGALTRLEALQWMAAGTAKKLDAVLARLGALRTVALHDKVSDATLAALAQRCPALAELRLHAGGGTDAGVAKLTALTELTALSLAGDGVTDASVAHVAKLPALRELGLVRTAVTDAGVAALAQACGGLTGLDLSKTPVTDACVASLATFKALESLRVGKTKISRKGLAQLASARPGLHISTYA